MPLFTSDGFGVCLGLVILVLGLGLVSSGLGLKNLVMFTSLNVSRSATTLG